MSLDSNPSSTTDELHDPGNDVIFLCLSFLICKAGNVTVTLSQDSYYDLLYVNCDLCSDVLQLVLAGSRGLSTHLF